MSSDWSHSTSQVSRCGCSQTGQWRLSWLCHGLGHGGYTERDLEFPVQASKKGKKKIILVNLCKY